MDMFGSPATEGEILEIAFGRESPVKGFDDEADTLEFRQLTLADLEVAAREKGFKVISLRAERGEEAVRAIRELTPVIARLRLYNEILHFVVIRGMQSEWVYISDPGYGNYKVPLQQFYQAWMDGDRYFLTIGTKPSYAWVSDETNETYIGLDQYGSWGQYHVRSSRANSPSTFQSKGEAS